MTATPRPRCVHYVGFRDDRYWNACRIFGGPRVIHRRWDFYATRDVGPDDIVVFAEGDDTQPVAERNATDLDERWLIRSSEYRQSLSSRDCGTDVEGPANRAHAADVELP